jgi:hypothetical protein
MRLLMRGLADLYLLPKQQLFWGRRVSGNLCAAPKGESASTMHNAMPEGIA